LNFIVYCNPKILIKEKTKVGIPAYEKISNVFFMVRFTYFVSAWKANLTIPIKIPYLNLKVEV
jgi:hypothetical protein